MPLYSHPLPLGLVSLSQDSEVWRVPTIYDVGNVTQGQGFRIPSVTHQSGQHFQAFCRWFVSFFGSNHPHPG